MRQLILKMSVSIDGFVGGPEGEIDWIFSTLDEANPDWTGFTTKTPRHQGRPSGLCAFGSTISQNVVFLRAFLRHGVHGGGTEVTEESSVASRRAQ